MQDFQDKVITVLNEIGDIEAKGIISQELSSDDTTNEFILRLDKYAKEAPSGVYEQDIAEAIANGLAFSLNWAALVRATQMFELGWLRISAANKLQEILYQDLQNVRDGKFVTGASKVLPGVFYSDDIRRSLGINVESYQRILEVLSV